jgi:lysyl endopeptidase
VNIAHSFQNQKKLFSRIHMYPCMKNFVLIIVLLGLFTQSSQGQMDTRLRPKSTQYIKSVFGPPAEILLAPFSQQMADSMDAEDALHDRLPKISRHIPVNINFDNAGNWTELPDGSRVWRVQIISKGALGIVPLFDNLYLPPGAALHFYMPDMREVLGAFTSATTPQPRSFCPGLIHGETCIVEYFEPAGQKGKGILSINKVGHAYRGVEPLEKSNQSGSGSCEVNVACPEGDNWRNQIRSVCKIFVVDLTGDGFCSGALVNNVRQDCSPYLLTAGHCTDYDSITDNEFGQWSFHFNNQASTCSGNTGPDVNIITGCKRVAYAYDSNGIDGSDFLLLLMSSYPPADFSVYYSGWDNTGTAPASGVGIHHPEGDIKKISTFNNAATSASWANNVLNTHWQLYWSATADGHGVTEPGSSGSPLYEPSGLIVGHLTGGISQCGGPYGPDLYGKISYDWTSNGVTPAYQLQPWLDPDNTGTTTLQGMNPPCGISAHLNAGIPAIDFPVGNICGLTFNPCFTLRNYGDDTLKSAVITYTIDNGSDSQFQWNGLLPGGAEMVVCSPASITVSAGSHTFTVVVSSPNGPGNTNTNTTTNVAESNFTANPSSGSVNLIINTDNDGSQNTWQISQGINVVASGGPFVDCYGGRHYGYPLCLPVGCYTFTIFDSNGDGMTDGENGNFQIIEASTGAVITQMQNPSFGAQESDNFCILASGIADLPAFNLTVMPNPSNGVFNVYFDDNQDKNIKLFDALGQLILEKNTNEQRFTIDLASFSKGVYLAQFSTRQGKVVKKLIVD